MKFSASLLLLPVFLRYGAGEGIIVFHCIIQRTEYGLSTRGAHSTLTVLLCFNYVKVTYCECLFSIAVTWYSTSIVPFLIAVWKKHSDLPAGRRNVNSLSRFDPKQLTEPNNQPNINARSHRAPLLRKSSIPMENVRQRAIWVQPSSRPTSASQLCAVLIGWKVARDGRTVAQSQEEEYQYASKHSCSCVRTDY